MGSKQNGKLDLAKQVSKGSKLKWQEGKGDVEARRSSNSKAEGCSTSIPDTQSKAPSAGPNCQVCHL